MGGSCGSRWTARERRKIGHGVEGAADEYPEPAARAEADVYARDGEEELSEVLQRARDGPVGARQDDAMARAMGRRLRTEEE